MPYSPPSLLCANEHIYLYICINIGVCDGDEYSPSAYPIIVPEAK